MPTKITYYAIVNEFSSRKRLVGLSGVSKMMKAGTTRHSRAN